MWHFSRPRSAGGFDVISIAFDKKRRPLFDAAINIVSAEGIKRPWGEVIKGSQATALASTTRIRVLKTVRRGVLAAVMRWLGHGWFGFEPRKNSDANEAAASVACEDFIGCLDQAERWWQTGELGPNLVFVDTGMKLRSTPPTS